MSYPSPSVLQLFVGGKDLVHPSYVSQAEGGFNTYRDILDVKINTNMKEDVFERCWYVLLYVYNMLAVYLHQYVIINILSKVKY